MKNVWLARTIDVKIKTPPPRPKITKPGRTKISVKQADAAGDEERHFQPARRAFEEVAPEEQGEGHHGHEGPDPQPRRVQLDIDAQPAQEDQHRDHFRPAEEVGQVIDPAGLDQRRDRSPGRSSA